MHSWINGVIIGTMNNNNGKWAKTRVTPEDYKLLKKMAVDEDVSLAELFRRALRTLVKRKEDDNNQERR